MGNRNDQKPAYPKNAKPITKRVPEIFYMLKTMACEDRVLALGRKRKSLAVIPWIIKFYADCLRHYRIQVVCVATITDIENSSARQKALDKTILCLILYSLACLG